ncbi:T9SS type A sorting domain-containing protein [Dyadobacter helix]|nr:T9SS type A sorting domain-containing protein [Dyadobacter sp. CECT 9275]
MDVLYKLPVTIQGQFNSDNKFSIQIKYDYRNEVIATVPAVLNNGNLEFTIDSPSLFSSYYSSIQLKVVASSPSVESAWTSNSIYAYIKGSINLSSLASSDTVNLYDDIPLQLKGVSNSDIRVTLSDSTKFNFSSYSGGFTQNQIYTVSKPGTFTIAHAENNCGTMQTSGSFKPVVNATSLTTTGIAPQTVCENGEVKISFSTQGAPLGAQTKYKIRFIQQNSSGGKPATAEVAAQLEGNYLTAKFPSTFVLTYTQEFSAQVVTENPSLVGSPSNLRFYVAPQPSAIFTSESQTVNINDYVSLQVALTGLPPFTLELSDGTKQTLSYYGSASVNVRPFESTSYSIKSLESGCGKKVFTNGQVVNITVRPGIRIEDDQKRQIVCAGTKARIKFRSNATLTAATQFSIVSGTGSETLSFPAVRNGEYLEFNIPNPTQSYPNYYNWRIVTSNPSLESQSSSYFNIQNSPSMSFSAYNTYSYEIPRQVNLNISLSGGYPYQIEMMDGAIARVEWDNYYNYSFYFKETQEFKIKSISNSCGKNDNLPSARVSLVATESPGIYIEPIKTTICDTDSVEITFGTVGKFNSENVFAIQGYSSSSTFQTLATTRQGGKFRVKLPATQYYSSYGAIRVASTNPVVFSEQKSINIQLPFTQIYLSPDAKQEAPAKYLVNQNNTYSLSIQTASSGPAASVTYTENGVEKTYINNDSYSTYIPLLPSSGTTTEYVIKSVNNQCGTFPVNAKTFISWVPYNIQFSDQSYYNNTFCVGGPIGVPFGIIDGASTNATFSLQIRKAETTSFTTLVSGETGRILNATIPASLTPGNYVLRIISSDGAISPDKSIQISAPPTATLTINPQSSPTVDFGNSVTMDITITGGNASVVFEDGSKGNYYEGKNSRYIYVQKGGVYSIKSVSNTCGYGTASGSVQVVVKPRLNVSSDSYGICEGGSMSVNYTLGGDADLSDDYIRFELLDTGANTTTVLDSTKIFSGTKLLKLPETLKGSYYQIRVTVRKYQLVYSLGTSITTKPDATLSGNTVINSGESTRLIITSGKSGNGNVQYVLSDGSKGSFWSQAGYANYITVSPKQTTTYTISSLSNSCGEGSKRGSAIVEVNPPADRTVSVTALASSGQSSFCTGDTVSVSFVAKGSFSVGNQMTVQLSDTTGRNFRSIATIGNASPLKAVLPTDMVSGKFYRLRVFASDPNTASGAFEYPITASQKARARFKSDAVIYQENTNPVITVLLEGGGPWTYSYGTDNAPRTRNAITPEDRIELLQASPNAYYKLFEVRNGCGKGIIDSPSTVRVELITGIEDPSNEAVTVAPNPTQDVIYLKFETPEKRSVEVFDIRGVSQLKRTISGSTHEMDVRALNTGVYILQIEKGGKRLNYRILKYP